MFRVVVFFGGDRHEIIFSFDPERSPCTLLGGGLYVVSCTSWYTAATTQGGCVNHKIGLVQTKRGNDAKTSSPQSVPSDAADARRETRILVVPLVLLLCAIGGYRWWALDAEGRPCAWPVVEAK